MGFYLPIYHSELVLVQWLTGMEIREFPNISFEHLKDSTFKKYRFQDLAPHRVIFSGKIQIG